LLTEEWAGSQSNANSIAVPFHLEELVMTKRRFVYSPALAAARGSGRWTPSRKALYGLFAVSIVGAATAPMFLVQRTPQQGQGELESAPPAAARTALAPAVPEGVGAEAGAPEVAAKADAPEVMTAAAPAQAQPELQSESSQAQSPQVESHARSHVRPQQHSPRQSHVATHAAKPARVAREVHASAFRPKPVAAWLPDPASYVARNSEADRGPALPATTSMASEASAVGATVMEQAAAVPVPVPALEQHETFSAFALAPEPSPQALLQPEPAVGDKNASKPEVFAQSESPAVTVNTPAQVQPLTQSEASHRGLPKSDLPQLSQPPASIFQHEKAPAPASLVGPGVEPQMPDPALAISAANPDPVGASEPTTIVVSAAGEGTVARAFAAEAPLALHVHAGDSARQSTPLEPADELVVVVAHNGSAGTQETTMVHTHGADVIVVAAGGGAPVSVDAELRGLSLALSTSMGIQSPRLARAAELPNWAVMGQGKKLRLSH
jgi:hypothetical protein